MAKTPSEWYQMRDLHSLQYQDDNEGPSEVHMMAIATNPKKMASQSSRVNPMTIEIVFSI